MLYLKQHRIHQGLSVPVLSKASTVPVRTIEDIEKRGDCRFSTAILLSGALGITLDQLATEPNQSTQDMKLA